MYPSIQKNERQRCLVVQHRLCIENRISSCKKETGSPLVRLRSKSYTLPVIHLAVCAWSAVHIACLAAIRSSIAALGGQTLREVTSNRSSHLFVKNCTRWKMIWSFFQGMAGQPRLLKRNTRIHSSLYLLAGKGSKRSKLKCLSFALSAQDMSAW